MTNPTDAKIIDLIPHGRAVVDAKAGKLVSHFKWHLDDRTPLRPRAFIWNYREKLPGFPEKLYLERLIAKAPKERYVRFLNLNTLDCRRVNLKIVNERRDTFLFDEKQRYEWELERGLGHVITEERQCEAWRMWCEGHEPHHLTESAYDHNFGIGIQVKAA